MSRQVQDLDPIEAAEVEIADLLALEDVSEPKTKRLTIGDLATVIQKFNYPIGSLYFNAEDDTDPATLLGFGTWEKHGEGRAIVSQKDGDPNFGTAGQLSGEAEVTLTESQMPSHNHTVNPPSTTTSSDTHNHNVPNTVYKVGSSTLGLAYATNDDVTWGSPATDNDTHSHTVNIAQFNSGSKGGGAAHNNVQPSIAVYVWKRTA